jgi:hypothetical protein
VADVFLRKQRDMRLCLALEIIVQPAGRKQRADAREEAMEDSFAHVGCLDEF